MALVSASQELLRSHSMTSILKRYCVQLAFTQWSHHSAPWPQWQLCTVVCGPGSLGSFLGPMSSV